MARRWASAVVGRRQRRGGAGPLRRRWPRRTGADRRHSGGSGAHSGAARAQPPRSPHAAHVAGAYRRYAPRMRERQSRACLAAAALPRLRCSLRGRHSRCSLRQPHSLVPSRAALGRRAALRLRVSADACAASAHGQALIVLGCSYRHCFYSLLGRSRRATQPLRRASAREGRTAGTPRRWRLIAHSFRSICLPQRAYDENMQQAMVILPMARATCASRRMQAQLMERRCLLPYNEWFAPSATLRRLAGHAGPCERLNPRLRAPIVA